MSASDKILSIVPNDIVSVAVGRGWKRARVLKTLADNMLLIKFKDGRKSKVSADHVLTEDEKKTFKKSQGQTKIVRQDRVSNNNSSEDIEEDEDLNEHDPSQDSIDKSDEAKSGIFRKLF